MPIEVAKLENLVECVRKDYSNDNIVLKSAFGRINKVEAWDHLEWLYAPRNSPTFLPIWTDARLDAGGGDTSKILTQEEVVKVVPKARSVWEELATGISRGSVPMGSVRWAVSQPWAQVVQELGSLEKTGGANAGDEMWAEAARNLQAMRLLDRLQGLAPAVLSLAQALEDLWTTDHLLQDDFKVECEAIVTNLASMSVTTLGRAQELAAPYRGTFEVLDEATQICLITAATLTDPIVWLFREAKKLDEFSGLIAITRPKTDDLRLLEGIAALQQTRTLLADMLYTSPLCSHTKQLMEAFASATIDGTAQRALEATQLSFKTLLDLLTRNTRSPGVQACYDLKMLCDTGTFSVVCSSVVSDQIICFVPDGKPKEWHREDLADLRQQLLMTEVPPDIEGRAELPNLLENFVAKCQILESYSHCVEELFSLGYFQLEVGQTVMTLAPGTSMDATRQLLVEREEILRDWEAEVAAARDKYYFLNYFVVRELRYLAKRIPSAAMHDDEAWKVTWSLLRIVSPQADEFHTRQQLDVMQDLTLGELGALLHELFEKTALVERPLSGFSGQVSSVGVHLIRRVSDHERDSDIDVVPVYICTVEEEPLVVEAVLSVFMSSSRVPQAKEMLFCSVSTTAEEVELLFRRFFSARTHGRQERIYCLAGAQLLPYMVQSRAIQTFRRLEEKLSFMDASCLAIVNGGVRVKVSGRGVVDR